MPRRHPKCPLPRLWLFTDERIADDRLLAAISALPAGSGIVFRHYTRAEPERRALFEQVRNAARRRRAVLIVAGSARLARAWKADGLHLSGSAARLPRSGARPDIVTMPVHNAAELAAARRAGADLVFVSPIFPTRSHPGGRTLGPLRLAALARRADMRIIALGGVTKARFRRLRPLGADGWAAVDGLSAAA